MFTASGLLVRFLKVFEQSNYNSVKWVRYLTKASGSYQIRVSIPRVIPSPSSDISALSFDLAESIIEYLFLLRTIVVIVLLVCI